MAAGPNPDSPGFPHYRVIPVFIPRERCAHCGGKGFLARDHATEEEVLERMKAVAEPTP